MGGLLGGFQKQMAELQAQAEREEVEATAGGLVTVRMNGAQEVLSIRIDPKAMDDRELVEDLLRAATNEAVRRSKDLVAQKLGQLAASMGLPPGLL
ncbi:MAG: YbaB/EbfC family nucleoid-associated protein [Pseudomonadota bacterium]|nr:YbaB/EbfC family nucleoid-associated protein [Pseudomonadota bacterium]